MLDPQQFPTGGEALLTVVDFSIGEVARVRRMRRGSCNADLGAEVLFRLGFVTGILTLGWPRPSRRARGSRGPKPLWWSAS